MTAAFECTLRDGLAGLAALSDAFRGWARGASVSDDVIRHADLALEELVTNVVLHGYCPDAGGPVSVRAECGPGALSIELRDRAPPFDPFRAPPPDLTAGIEDRSVGGLGVYFVRSLMSECSYQREDDQNVVRLRKALEPPR